MSDDFEQPQYKVGRMPGDLRRYYVNRPLAERFAERGYELFGSVVYTTAVQFEPDHGFVAVLFTDGPLPSAAQEGYEVQDARRPVADPDTARAGRAASWNPAPPTAKPGKAASGAPTAPAKGATARVWTIADEVGASSRADRAKVIDACVAAGINPSTAATQWSKYAKAKGW